MIFFYIRTNWLTFLLVVVISHLLISCVHSRENGFEILGSSLRLNFSTINTVLKRIQTLSGRIGIRDFSIVHKCYISSTPALKKKKKNYIALFHKSRGSVWNWNRLKLLNCTIKHLATLHPSVPAPRIRHFVLCISSKSKSGNRRHFISFKFKSTDDSANLKNKNLSIKHAR